jgi:hypothetical protein
MTGWHLRPNKVCPAVIMQAVHVPPRFPDRYRTTPTPPPPQSHIPLHKHWIPFLEGDLPWAKKIDFDFAGLEICLSFSVEVRFFLVKVEMVITGTFPPSPSVDRDCRGLDGPENFYKMGSNARRTAKP